MIVSKNPAHVNYTTSDLICGSDVKLITPPKPAGPRKAFAGPPTADKKFNPLTQVQYKSKFGGKCKYCSRPIRKNSWIYCNQNGPSPTRWCCTPECTHLLALDPQRMYR